MLALRGVADPHQPQDGLEAAVVDVALRVKLPTADGPGIKNDSDWLPMDDGHFKLHNV